MARLPRIPRSRPLLAPEESRGEVTLLAAGTELARIYFAGGPHPGGWNAFRRYGPTSARFDHHLPPPRSHPDRAILYAASDLTTAAAEVFQDTGTIDIASGEPYLAIVRLRRPIRLLSLRSNWPTRAGASQALASGSHASARGWSIAIHEDLADIEGLEFDSSMNRGGVNYALYERAEDALELAPVANIPLTHRGLRPALRHVAVDLGFDLALPKAATSTLGPGGGLARPVRTPIRPRRLG